MSECRKYDGEDVQNVVERLLKAGWINGAHVTATGFALDVTEKGHAQMMALADVVKPLAPTVFGMEKRKAGIMGWARFLVRWSVAAAELQPPAFSDGQRDTLASIVLNYSMDGPSQAGRYLFYPAV
jgi:hypothetical protein